MRIFGIVERLADDIYPYRWLVAVVAAAAVANVRSVCLDKRIDRD